MLMMPRRSYASVPVGDLIVPGTGSRFDVVVEEASDCHCTGNWWARRRATYGWGGPGLRPPVIVHDAVERIVTMESPQ